MAITRAFKNGVNYDDFNALKHPVFQNGSMDICQRSTSVTGITSEQKLTDRWSLNIGSSGTFTFTVGTGPGTFGLNKCIKLDCTSANASGSDSDANMYITIPLEGQDVQLFRKGTSDAKAFTISFFVRSNKTGTGIVEIWDRDNDRILSKTYTIDSADTWERKCINYTMETANALDNDNAKSLMVGWWIESGADFDGGTLGTSWAGRTDANRAVGQTLNMASSTDNEFLLTGCMMVPGTFTTETIPDFVNETFAENLARCQRYCFLMKASTTYTRYTHGIANSTEQAEGVVSLPVAMRAGPTLTTSTTAAEFACGDGAALVNCDAVPIVGNASTVNPCFQDVFWPTAGSLTQTEPYALQGGNNTNTFLRFESEI